MTTPSSAPDRDLTLQINFSGGDIAYAEATAPALVAAHPRAAERLAVVDCCRPQRTRIFDPDRRLPAAEFSRRAREISRIVLALAARGLFDRVEFLLPGDPRVARFARRYVRPWMTETHDYGGCAFAGYWAALELPATRFVLHYDADMLLHQQGGFDWTEEARDHWELLPRVIAAAPRASPPGFAATPEEDGSTCHEGRPRSREPGGWLNDWFSTRCLLIDRRRLEPRLPLIGLRNAWEMRARRWLNRGYPPVPEQVLFRRLGGSGFRCLHLETTKAWLLHPAQKGPPFVRLLPEMLARVAAGSVPPEQRGYADVRIDAWEACLEADRK